MTQGWLRRGLESLFCSPAWLSAEISCGRPGINRQRTVQHLLTDAGFLPELPRDADGTLIPVDRDKAPRLWQRLLRARN